MRLYNATHGYKTYIAVLALFVLGGLVYTGYLDQPTAETIERIVLGLLGLGLYSKMNRNFKK